MSVIELLKEKSGFTSAERDIADYILHNAESIAHMSIAELSAATYCSNATVVRLCRKLGVDGYRDLRIALATELERRRGALRDVDANEPFTSKDSTATILRSVAQLSKEALDSCYASLSPTSVEMLAHAIANAQHVLLYAIGDSFVSAEAFAELSSKLGVSCTLVYRRGNTLPHAYVAGERDVAIFITYSGIIFDRLVEDIDVLKARGCALAAITAIDTHSETLEGFDMVVSLPSQERAASKVATYYSQECIRYVLNCLYSCIYALEFDENRRQKDEIEQRSGTM